MVVPLLQVGVLILEGVGQLMGQHRLLLLDVHPVEHVDGLGFGVVVGLDLLLEERQQKGLERKIAVEEAELLEDNFALLEALGALVFLELLLQITLHFRAGGKLALDVALDGQAGFTGGELDQLIDQAEELLRLFGRDAGLRLGGALGWDGGLAQSLVGRLGLRGRCLLLRRRSQSGQTYGHGQNPSAPTLAQPCVLLPHRLSFGSGCAVCG